MEECGAGEGDRSSELNVNLRAAESENRARSREPRVGEVGEGEIENAPAPSFSFLSKCKRHLLDGAYLFQFLEAGRRNVRVPADLRAARWSESAAECAYLTSGRAEPGVAVPPLERLENRHFQQRIRRFLRHDRLIPRGDLTTADATSPGRLQQVFFRIARFDRRPESRLCLFARSFRVIFSPLRREESGDSRERA